MKTESIQRILGRHARSVPILGEKAHQVLSESTVVVAGLGAIGSAVCEITIRQGVGRVIVVDPDSTIEIHNLDRQLLYREADIGKSKAHAVKEISTQINPEVEVIAYKGTFTQAVCSSLGSLIASSDLLISTIDNKLGRYSVSQYAFSRNIPHLDGATGGYNCRAYIFPDPQNGPCYGCILTKNDYEEISRVYSCTRKVNENTVAPAIAQTSILVATILSMEAVKLLAGNLPIYNEIRVNLFDWTIHADRIEPNSSHKDAHV